MGKIPFDGRVDSVQPRIRLLRSFDEVSHNYLGYALRITGSVAGVERQFSVGIGKSAQAKQQFRVGDYISGECLPVANPDLEVVDFYKASSLWNTPGEWQQDVGPPPWCEIPPDLDVYRERGHRRLAEYSYDTHCLACMWGCRMAVEMIIDPWNPSRKEYRQETFCYGPLNCSLYEAGPNREVPGRQGMVYVEEDWVDEENTSYRQEDE